MTAIEIATAYFAAEYQVPADSPLIAEIVADLPADALDAIVATVESQPWLIEA